MPTTIFIRIQWLSQTRALLVDNDELVFTIKQRICVILGLDVDIYCTNIQLKSGPLYLQNELSLYDYNICNNASVQCLLPRIKSWNSGFRRRNIDMFAGNSYSDSDTNIRRYSSSPLTAVTSTASVSTLTSTNVTNNSDIEPIIVPVIVENVTADATNDTALMAADGADDDSVAGASVYMADDEKKEVGQDNSWCNDDYDDDVPVGQPSLLYRVSSPVRVPSTSIDENATASGKSLHCKCSSCSKLQVIEDSRVKRAIDASIVEQKEFERRSSIQKDIHSVQAVGEEVVIVEG